MSYFLFIDESGVDQQHSPYEVLAGIVIRDQDLWDLILEVRKEEVAYFGRRISAGALELKGKKLLKTKTFRLARQLPPMGAKGRASKALSCIEKGEQQRGPTRDELTALAQAKLAFVQRVLTMCQAYNVRAFASIVPKSAPRPASSFLRKDYAYLFERFFYYLDQVGSNEHGVIVFDELERSKCHILHDQMALYFKDTATGMLRATRILPEPLFVHSELTTAVQIADLVAYIISWGVRFKPMTEPFREELKPFVRLVCDLRYQTTRQVSSGDEWTVWSFKYIRDLRPGDERG